MRTSLAAAVGVLISVILVLLAGCSTSSAGSALAALSATDSGGAGPPTATRGASAAEIATTAGDVDSTVGTAAVDTAAASSAAISSAADTVTARSAPTAGLTPPTSSPANTGRDPALARLVAGAPPKNLAWQLPKKMPGWTMIAHQAGALTYKVGEGCSVMVAQPSYPAGEKRSSAELARDAVTQLTRLLQSDPSMVEVVNTHKAFLAASVAGVTGSTKVEFAGLRTHFPDLPATAQTYAYANGQFGLVITAACADPDLDTYDTVIAPQLQRFTVLVVY